MNLPEVGSIHSGTVIKVFPTYAIMLFDGGWTALLHISELSNSYIRNIAYFIPVGTIHNVKVVSVDEESGKIHVSLKKLSSGERHQSFPKSPVPEKDISFDALKGHLPSWIEDKNKEESTND